LHLAIKLERSPAAENALFLWEQSTDLTSWTSASGMLQLVSEQTRANGLLVQQYREVDPLSASSARFIRLRVVGP